MTSFCMHFENIGRGLLHEGKRSEGEWAVCGKSGGMNRNVEYFSKLLVPSQVKYSILFNFLIFVIISLGLPRAC